MESLGSILGNGRNLEKPKGGSPVSAQRRVEHFIKRMKNDVGARRQNKYVYKHSYKDHWIIDTKEES